MTEWNDDRSSEPLPESSTGKVLFYFFAVVVLCAVSAAVGYMMGKRATPAPTAETGAPTTTVAGNGAAKPAPMRAEPTADNSMQEPAEATPAAATKEPKAEASAKPAAKTKTPEISGAAMSGFMVQVAAVSRQEDADALAGALRKKQYPVFVMPGTGADKLLHVQVGPFAELKDAEAMKAKLAADGYNAIVKK
jgi:DedD protein